MKTDWIKDFDVSAKYTLPLANGQAVSVTASIFNLFDSKGVEDRNEFGENGQQTPNPYYSLPTLYQAPRYMRLSLDYSF
ncbi:MAG: hypothetical protein WDN06_07145 [Asticcacaulis sp.]